MSSPRESRVNAKTVIILYSRKKKKDQYEFLQSFIFSLTHAHASSLIFSSILSSALVTLSWLVSVSWSMEAFSVKSDERVVTKPLWADIKSSGYRLNKSRLCTREWGKIATRINGIEVWKMTQANLVNSPRYHRFPRRRSPSSTPDSAAPSSTDGCLQWC